MRTTDDGWDRYVDHLPVAQVGWEEGVERDANPSDGNQYVNSFTNWTPGHPSRFPKDVKRRRIERSNARNARSDPHIAAAISAS